MKPEAAAEAANYEHEEQRIRATYARRDRSGKLALYAWFRPDVLLSHYRFQAVAAELLRRAAGDDLSSLRALDVGCGSGGWLRQLLAWGARAENLHGVDLLADRIASARQLSPQIDYRQGSGWRLPFPDGAMDLVSAHTVFSSILDGEARVCLAREMVRILAPNGKVLIFDFRISHPLNADTIGISAGAIQRLFPGFVQRSRSLLLAAPIARRVAPISPLLAAAMEALCPPLRTHTMCLLERPPGRG